MLALKSMEVVALHKEIIVMTDNSHLFHLNTWQAINARQKRTLAYLMQFRLQVRYIKGKDNLQADCLSRLFQESTEERKDFIPTYGLEQDDFILAVSTSAKSHTLVDKEEEEETTPPRRLQEAHAMQSDAPATCEIEEDEGRREQDRKDSDCLIDIPDIL